MFRRGRTVADPVTLTLDGARITAERGEPLAAALLAADLTTIARSPKLHRPRGAACLRGGCDGCLARVDGEPNVMTCLVPARGGERIETQNYLGSRKADLLRVTDWFFPNGIDHHHLLVGVPGLSEAMQGFARKLAGLGRMPSVLRPERPARRAATDVLVVGGGLAGLTAAATLRRAGLSVWVVDDGPVVGGGQAWLDRLGAPPLPAPETYAGAEVHTSSTVGGLYAGEALLVTPQEAVLLTPRATLLATGAHDGVLVTANNDLPGVLSARALARLLALGVEPDGPTCIVGDSWFGRLVKGRLGDGAFEVGAEDVLAIHGTGGVRGVALRSDDGERTREAALVAVATPGAPAFELALQAGAEARLGERGGYGVLRDEDGRAAPALWATGEVTGAPFDPVATAADAEHVAESVIRALG